MLSETQHRVARTRVSLIWKRLGDKNSTNPQITDRNRVCISYCWSSHSPLTEQGKDEAKEATSGWAPSLYRIPLSSPHSSCLPQRPRETGESSPVGYRSCSTSTFISSQRPVLAAQESTRAEKYNQNKGGELQGRGEKKVKCILQVLFLSSDGHLDIYRDLVHNHFNICECLWRLESRR